MPNNSYCRISGWKHEIVALENKLAATPDPDKVYTLINDFLSKLKKDGLIEKGEMSTSGLEIHIKVKPK